MVVVGIFSNDYPVQGEGSFANRIHDQVSGLMFLFVIIGTFMLGFSFRSLPSWRNLWIYTLLSALVSLGLLIAFFNSMESAEYTGMWQRLFLFSVFIWLGIVAIHIIKDLPEIDLMPKDKNLQV
jgi:magnesium-transporting ATPase (P-type)